MERTPCVKCKTAGGVATCEGCKKSFCTTHFVEHRQELSLEMENVGQSYDLLRRDLSDECEEHPLITQINAWERESVTKIQKAAEIARMDLQKLIDEKKFEIESSLTTTMEEIRTSRDSKDFTENQLKRWIEQLNEIRQAYESPPDIKIENDSKDKTAIGLIKIYVHHQHQAPSFSSSESVDETQCSSSGKRNFLLEEKFDLRTDAKLTDNCLIATCSPKYGSPGAIVYCSNSYSDGIYDISFRIEKKGLSRLFFGICSASKRRVEAISSGTDNSVYGWWDLDSQVLNGTRREAGTQHIISTGDKIVLTLDCAHHQIQLYHIRENRQNQVPVDLNKCPFPWKIIVKLTANYDCVRII